MKCNSQVFFLVGILFLWSEYSVAIQKNIFDPTLEQVEAALLSKNLIYKRKILKKLAADNIELRPREVLGLIQMGLEDSDSYVREYSIAALQRLAYFYRTNKNIYSSDKFPIVSEFLDRQDLKSVLKLMVNDKSTRVRMAALSTLEFGYGPEEDVKNIILAEIEKENNPNSKRDMVLLLGFGKYASDKKVQSKLMNILHNEKTEASEVSAVVLASINPPVLDAMPEIMNLLESDERFADDDLLRAIASFGYWAKPYLARLYALEKGIDDRIKNPNTSVNFKRHAEFLKLNLKKSVNYINMENEFYFKKRSYFNVFKNINRVSVFLKSNKRHDFLFSNIGTSTLTLILILIFSFLFFIFIGIFFVYKKYKLRA
jgi:hypothetical protein